MLSKDFCSFLYEDKSSIEISNLFFKYQNLYSAEKANEKTKSGLKVDK